MTEAAKIGLVKAMTDETDDEIISAFLSLAGDAICHYADPFNRADQGSVLDRYGGVQARAAAYFLNKRGADLQSGHTENGVSRQYEAADLPPSLLREITPICGLLS